MTRPDQTPDAWNSASEAYDQNIWNLMNPWVETMLVRGEPHADQDVVDIAAGSGALSVALAPRVRRVLAVDFAENMLAQARQRARHAGLSNVEAEVMDGQALTLDDASFDAAYSNFGVIFFPDRVKGFSEMHRVLRPGGRAVISAASAPERFEIFGMFLGAAKAALPDLPLPPGPPPMFSLASRDKFDEELRAGGFDEVVIDTVSHPGEFASFDELWHVLCTSTPPTLALLEKVGPQGGERVRSTLFDRLHERFGDGTIRLNNEAHIAVATR